MTVKERRSRRFSETFKRQIVSQIDREEITIKHVSVLYEVKADNVKRWVKQFGKSELPVPILIQTVDETSVIKDLKKKNEQLTNVIADSSIELLMLKATLKSYQEKYGYEHEKKTKLKSFK